MDSKAIHDYARRLVGAHGDKAELEAAQRAARCEQQGEKAQAQDWRRIQAAIRQMRGPHAS
jgi:Arc/MetJ family transcription regulator